MSWTYALLISIAIALFALIVSSAPTEAPELPIVDIVLESAPVTATATVALFPQAELAPEATPITKPPLPAQKPAVQQTPPQTNLPEGAEKQITRLQNPYPFPPLSEGALNTITRVSLMNIFCIVDNGQSVSGSGVVIDPRGVVLTNAHVGQFVLLSEVSSNIDCIGRAGAPAQAKWKLRVVFMPETWVNEHAQDLRSPQPKGTGEHDYALLLLQPLDGIGDLPPVTSVGYDAREAVSFEGDNVILGAYPAGFVGGFIVQNNLYPATTFTTLKKLYTFVDSSIDIFSLGGVILAQGGSSGGGVINQWGRLVGLTVTTSEGATTAERDLRAISLAHVDRSMRQHTGLGLAEFLSEDVEAHANRFRNNELSTLAQKLVNEIPQQ